MTIVKKVQVFTNINGVSDYLKMNLNFVQVVTSLMEYIESQTNKAPFTNNLLYPSVDTTINGVSYTGSSTPSTPIADTNLYYFTNQMKTETITFRDACATAYQELLHQKVKAGNPNFDFLTVTFTNAQTKFLKNLINYFTIFSFFTNMSSTPSLQVAGISIISDYINGINSANISNGTLTFDLGSNQTGTYDLTYYEL
jgi:hypothetical protein